MPLTDQEKLDILKQQGLEPWQAHVVETPDEIQIHPTKTEERGALETGLRHFGANLPRTAVGLLAGKGATAALVPTTLTGPAGFVATLAAGAGEIGRAHV